MKPQEQAVPPTAIAPLVAEEFPPRYLFSQRVDEQVQTSSEEARRALAVYRQLVRRASDVFGDSIRASLWLSQPSPDFGGMVPLEAAQQVGYVATEIERLFEPVFVRIEEGIYW